MKKILVVGLSGESVFMNTDHFNENDETIQADSIHIEPGGKGFNQCVAVKRLSDYEVHYLTMVGNDNYKNECKKFLKKEKIKTHFIVHPTEKTAYAAIVTDKNGTSRITVYPGASSKLEEKHILKYEKLISKMDLVLIQLELGIDVVNTILDMCNKYSIPVVLNPAPVSKNIDFEILKKATVLTPNTHEARIIFNYEESSTIEEIISSIKNQTNQTVIVTLGSKGALLVSEKESILIPTDKKTPVDTTGAGDVFNGAFVSKYFENIEIKEKIIFANKAASYSVMRKYVMDSIPHILEVK